MNRYTEFPEKRIAANGLVSEVFTEMEISTFHAACRYVHQVPYGYNSNRDDLMILARHEPFAPCGCRYLLVMGSGRFTYHYENC